MENAEAQAVAEMDRKVGDTEEDEEAGETSKVAATVDAVQQDWKAGEEEVK